MLGAAELRGPREGRVAGEGRDGERGGGLEGLGERRRGARLGVEEGPGVRARESGRRGPGALSGSIWRALVREEVASLCAGLRVPVTVAARAWSSVAPPWRVVMTGGVRVALPPLAQKTLPGASGGGGQARPSRWAQGT